MYDETGSQDGAHVELAVWQQLGNHLAKPFKDEANTSYGQRRALMRRAEEEYQELMSLRGTLHSAYATLMRAKSPQEKVDSAPS
jgi:hypothetical protein